jgi:hypothetical protein
MFYSILIIFLSGTFLLFDYLLARYYRRRLEQQAFRIVSGTE